VSASKQVLHFDGVLDPEGDAGPCLLVMGSYRSVVRTRAVWKIDLYGLLFAIGRMSMTKRPATKSADQRPEYFHQTWRKAGRFRASGAYFRVVDRREGCIGGPLPPTSVDGFLGVTRPFGPRK
jgi:hypothetical protein